MLGNWREHREEESKIKRRGKREWSRDYAVPLALALCIAH